MQSYALNARPLDWYDYGFRMYDPQLARFHTLDPLTEYFPRQSPFVYANNNPIRYIDHLGLSASDTTYIAPDIEPVVIVGTRPNNNSNNSGSSSWWATTWLGRWWNRNKPYYDERYVNDHMSQDLNHLDIFGNQAGVTPVIPRENKSLNDKVFGRRNKRKKPKIEGDKGAIEKTMSERVKSKINVKNSPTLVSSDTTNPYYPNYGGGIPTVKRIYSDGNDTTIILQPGQKPIRYPDWDK